VRTTTSDFCGCICEDLIEKPDSFLFCGDSGRIGIYLATVRRGRRVGRLVERAAIAFNNAVTDLIQIDILENDGTAISAFEGQTPAAADRSPMCDLENYAPTSLSLSRRDDCQPSHTGSPPLIPSGGQKRELRFPSLPFSGSLLWSSIS